jgi:hypothetical protein
MLYLTGSGINPKTTPILAAHPMIGALATPASLALNYVEPFRHWGADNGCFAQPHKFTMSGYLAWLRRMLPIANRCHFATAPDVVGDAAATWERSRPTLPQLRAAGYRAALVAQNGLEDMDVAWSEFDALFIGGDDAWKLSACAHSLVGEAKRRGKWVHMGRVNSLRRLQIAADFGCDSADGNFLAWGPDQNLPRLLRWLTLFEPSLFSPQPEATA